MMGNVGFTVWVSGDDGMMGTVFSVVFILQVIKYSFVFNFSFHLFYYFFCCFLINRIFISSVFFLHFVLFVEQVIEWVISLLLDTI